MHVDGSPQKREVNAVRDCYRNIQNSIKKLNNADLREARQFFYGLFPDKATKQKVKIEQWEELRWVLAYMFYHQFYKTFCKYDAPTFPSPTRYEVLIAFRQAKSKFIQYAIVPRGARAGDTVILLRHIMPGPVLSGITRSLVEVLKPHLAKKPTLGRVVPHKLPVQTIKNFSELAGSFNKRAVAAEVGVAKMDYTLGKLPEEPSIRLPCYNVPLQCAWEMASKDLKDFTGEPVEILKKLIETNKPTHKMERIPPEPDMLRAMLCWSTWEAIKLSMKERHDYLVDMCREEGIPCSYDDPSNKSEVFALRVNRMFKTHLAKNPSG